MTSQKANTHTVFLRKTFWQRFGTYLMADMLVLSKILGLFCATIFGFIYFLFGFDFFKKDLLTWVIMPVLLFFLVKYLTILPVILFPLFLFVKRSWLFTTFYVLAVVSIIFVSLQ